MIDHAARRQIANTIRSYMNEEISAFQFADDLDLVGMETDDPTVHEIVRLLWYHYDDLKNHKIVASKVEWDYFHRLLLILESDAKLDVRTARIRSPRQAAAVCCLIVFIALAAIIAAGTDWGPHLLAVGIPFGFASMLLSYWRSKSTPEPGPSEIALTPFSSVHQLLAVRRRVPHFTKTHYPEHLVKRRIRHPVVEIPLSLIAALGIRATWLLFGPMVLLRQAISETNRTMTVRVPQDLGDR